MTFLKAYRKSLVAVVVTIVSAIAAATTNGITTQEWINVAIAGVTAAAVFTAPNVPGARYTKEILAGLGAVLALLTSLIVGGLNAGEVWQLVLAGLGAAGVYVVPNVGSSGVNLSATGTVGEVK